MQYIITKEWRDIPSRQRATLRVYTTRQQAEHKAAELRRVFPGRIFRVVPSPSKGNDRS